MLFVQVKATVKLGGGSRFTFLTKSMRVPPKVVPLGARNQIQFTFWVCAPKTPMCLEVEGRPTPMLSEIFKVLQT